MVSTHIGQNDQGVIEPEPPSDKNSSPYPYANYQSCRTQEDDAQQPNFDKTPGLRILIVWLWPSHKDFNWYEKHSGVDSGTS
jgi:hypothetical protein